MTGVSVRGGSGGIEAHYDDMTALARLFGAAATSTAEHAMTLHGYLINPDVVSAAVIDPYGAARFSGALLDALDGPDGLSWLAAQCGAKDLGLRTAAATYLEADRLKARVLPAVEGWLEAMTIAPDTVAGALQGHPFDAVNRFSTGESDLFTAVASRFWTSWGLINLVSTYPDGRPEVHPKGVDHGAVAGRVPRSLTDIVSALANRNDHRSGGDIDVRFITSIGPDGRPVRHVIVDIPGIDTLNPSWGGPDPTTFGANLRSVVGAPTTYSNGVIRAMRDAGVRPGEPVMLVGHSQGGMVAMNVAGAGQFNVTHVITVGSPVAHIAVPRSVQVLSIENEGDLVPHLDGASNPDHVNQTTVTVHRSYGPLIANHDVDNYVTSAATVAGSDDPSVRTYLSGIAGFLGGSSVSTHVFGVRRHVVPQPDDDRRRSTDPRSVR